MIRTTGTLAQSNPFRLSTKYQDDQTGFLYYGYRYYDPSTGRDLLCLAIAHKTLEEMWFK